MGYKAKFIKKANLSLTLSHYLTLYLLPSFPSLVLYTICTTIGYSLKRLTVNYVTQSLRQFIMNGNNSNLHSLNFHFGRDGGEEKTQA